MASQPPPPSQPPRKKSFRWGQNDPDHPFESFWGRWIVRPSKKWRPPGKSGPPGPPPAA